MDNLLEQTMTLSAQEDLGQATGLRQRKRNKNSKQT